VCACALTLSPHPPAYRDVDDFEPTIYTRTASAAAWMFKPADVLGFILRVLVACASALGAHRVYVLATQHLYTQKVANIAHAVFANVTTKQALDIMKQQADRFQIYESRSFELYKQHRDLTNRLRTLILGEEDKDYAELLRQSQACMKERDKNLEGRNKEEEHYKVFRDAFLFARKNNLFNDNTSIATSIAAFKATAVVPDYSPVPAYTPPVYTASASAPAPVRAPSPAAFMAPPPIRAASPAPYGYKKDGVTPRLSAAGRR